MFIEQSKCTITRDNPMYERNPWISPHLPHRRHQCPSWRSSSWHAQDGHLRTETSDWSQCASGNPAGRWMMECWPPSAGRILRNMSIILNLNIWLPQSQDQDRWYPACVFSVSRDDSGWSRYATSLSLFMTLTCLTSYLFPHSDVSLPDQNSGVMDGLGKSQLENLTSKRRSVGWNRRLLKCSSLEFPWCW